MVDHNPMHTCILVVFRKVVKQTRNLVAVKLGLHITCYSNEAAFF